MFTFVKNEERPLDTAKRIIKENYADFSCGIFNTGNVVGDPMVTIYKDDSIRILGCYKYAYFEVFGLSNDDAEKLYDYYNSLDKGV